MAISIGNDELERFRSTITGEALIDGDPGYDEARAVHNGFIDKRPALIARCRDTADVVAAVKLAREPVSRSRSGAAATTWRAGP